jgi:D-glycero-alpha-D-manno-heptose-7-phosphate kinase
LALFYYKGFYFIVDTINDGEINLIIVQTPLRISLFGGGTDFPDYFREQGGAVLTSAIDKYIFIIIRRRFDDMLRIGYTQTELVKSIDEIKHELIREALRKTGVSKGVEITTMGDIPAGTGLGSSSAVTVGALQSMYMYTNETLSAERLAREACEIEVKTLGKPIGFQDQYIAAYGGLRFIEFLGEDEVNCERVNFSSTLLAKLNEHLILFYTGITRDSNTILSEQKDNIKTKIPVLNKMKEIAITARDQLLEGNVDSIGELLHESYTLKKQLASQIITSPIEFNYQTARRAGAIGGKITGAGGGGFLLLYCPLEKKDKVRAALKHLREMPFHFAPTGSRVIFDYR